MQRRTKDAGRPHCSLHGLRKAGATRAAENGATVPQMMAIFGWAGYSQAEVYVRKAERKKMATAGIQALVQRASDNEAVEGVRSVPLLSHCCDCGGKWDKKGQKTQRKQRRMGRNGAVERHLPSSAIRVFRICAAFCLSGEADSNLDYTRSSNIPELTIHVIRDSRSHDRSFLRDSLGYAMNDSTNTVERTQP
jgi:hypothetical protein